ncbi:M23 family metallopeptidase [Leucothrix sargassi]|nr:M23 family metallopeptidase [Leucothrix sargassi]
MKIQFNTFKSDEMPILDLALGRHFLLPAIILSVLIIAFSAVVERNTKNSVLNQQFSELAYHAQMKVLSQKVARLDGESQRLKAFAQRMASAANVDISAFAFDKAAGQGGLGERASRNMPNLMELHEDIQTLDQKMLAYSSQLERLQLILKSGVASDKSDIISWPVADGYVSSNFGWRKDPFSGAFRKHHGLDIAAKRGTPVMSIADGKVVFVGRNGGYGRVVEIQHANDVISRYAHLDAYLVKKGESVKSGQRIAKVGSSGRSTGPHLHLEIINKKQRVNPKSYLSRNDPVLSVKFK